MHWHLILIQDDHDEYLHDVNVSRCIAPCRFRLKGSDKPGADRSRQPFKSLMIMQKHIIMH